ncbi:MAG: DUF4347 domain-containing protein, partial [Oscillatoria princeps RMCB-10]|nr:DUF4347 domain-containing protein [Oscillatoria princeps RMCB-10]
MENTTDPAVGAHLVGARKENIALTASYATAKGDSVVIIDPAVKDWKFLRAGVVAGAEVIVLDPVRDGVEQIGDTLSRSQGISSLHIISHGSPATLKLGSAQLSHDTLGHYASQLQQWSAALNHNAGILIYGCEVAAGDIGKAFVREVSRLAGVPVAASARRTGSAALGGDWELEVTTGEIEACLAFEKPVMEAYSGVFGEPPSIEWIQQLGSAGWDESRGVAVDSQGNVYISGDTYGASDGDYGTWLAKYDSTGSQLWVRHVGSASSDNSCGIAIDSAANVYITGATYSELGGSSAGGWDTWIAKYDASGTQQWVKQLGSAGQDMPSGIATDSAGNVCIVGNTWGALAGSNAGECDAWVAKYDSSGTELWSAQLGSVDYDDSRNVATDSAGNVYIIGSTLGALGGSNAGDYDAWAAKYDSNGNQQWVKQLGGTGCDYFFDVKAVDSTGQVYIVGDTLSDAWLLQYDSNGNLQWVQQFGTPMDEYAGGVTVDSAGNLYLTGKTEGALGDSNAGGGDLWVAQYDSTGTEQWVKQFGTASTEYSFDIAVDSALQVYICGLTEGDLGASNAGEHDAWVAKLGSNTQPLQIYTQSLEPGEYSAYDVYGPYTGLYREDGSAIGSLDDEAVFGRPDRDEGDLLWFTSGSMTWNYSLNIPTQSTIKSFSYTAEVSSEYPGSNLNWPSTLNVNFNGVNAGSWTMPGDPGDGLGYQENHLWDGASQYGWLTTWTVDETGTYLEYKFRTGDSPKVKISEVTIDELGIVPGEDVSVTLSIPYSEEGFGLNLYGDTWGDWDSDPTITIAYDAPDNTAPALEINTGLILDEAGTAAITPSLLMVADADGDAITHTVTALPANGTLKLNNTALAVNDTFTQADINNGNLTYTHNGSETASDGFSFTATDGFGGNISSTDFAITVNPINDAPTVANPILNQMAIADTAFNFQLDVGTFADVDSGDSLSYNATLLSGSQLPAWLSFDSTTGTFSGTPANGDAGTLSIQVTATDTAGESVSDSFDLRVNGNPIAEADTAATDPGIAVKIDALDGDMDPDGDHLQVVSVTNGTHGVVKINQDLYAGGWFTTAGGAGANHVAKWDGSSWSPLGSGVDNLVTSIALDGNNLYAAGWFTTAGGTPANGLAKWDGSSWSPLGSGVENLVESIAVDDGSNLYATGWFGTAGGSAASHIAQWDGSSWSPLGSGLDGVSNAQLLDGSDLYASGWFTTAGGVSANHVAKWDGSNWSPLGSGTDHWVYALAGDGTDLYAGGPFTSAGGVSANYIASWDGSSWSPLGSGMNQEVNALAKDGSDLYATGWFTTAGGVSANHVAKWDGSEWSPLGSGLNGQGMVLAESSTDLYAGGNFTSAGGVNANYIAQWDGSSWSALGSGMNNWVRAIAVDPGQSVTYTPDPGFTGIDTFTYTVSDGFGGLATATVAVRVGNNSAPTVANPIGDFQAAADTAFNFQLDAGTFADVDSGDSLSYNATLLSGSQLPAWLSFDSSTGTFSGTPANGDAGTLSIQVTATDTAGESVSDSFDLTVNPAGEVTDETPVSEEGGNDTLTEDAGATTLPGDTVGDTLTEDAGATTLPGDTVGDTLTEDAGTTTLPGDTVGDSLSADTGTTTLPGDTVGDTLTEDAGATTLPGDTVGDTLTEDAGATTLPGDTVGDTLTEDAGATTLPGDTVGDTLTEDTGTTTLPGDTVGDSLSADTGTTTLPGDTVGDTLTEDAGATTLP